MKKWGGRLKHTKIRLLVTMMMVVLEMYHSYQR